LQPRISISFFAGPQHSNNYGGGLIPVNSWSPTYGGSFGWQSGNTSLALSASRSISAGGGLQGAVRSANVNASVRRQLAKALSAQLSAFYSKNTVLGALPQFSDGGHTTSGTVSLNRQVQENLDLTLAYTRLQQKYSNIATFSSAPNQNRVSISLSYQFTRRRIGQ
jgi:predicted porin